MPSTSELNIINLQVFAEGQANIDKRDGTYTEKFAGDSKYYLWHGDLQTIPMGMRNNPEQFVESIVEALPTVNCLRVPFNRFSFNADGTLDPLFERFLASAAAHGLQIIPVLMDGSAQRSTGTQAELSEILRTDVIENMTVAWTSMMTWMDNHPTVKNAVYGWELANEPATYERALDSGPKTQVKVDEFVSLYVDHMKALGEIVQAHSDAKILVDFFGFAGQAEDLANANVGTGNAIDALRQAFDDSLVWSVHYYPGWRGTGGASSPSEIVTALQEIFAPVSGDSIIVTETNATGGDTYNPYSGSLEITSTVLAHDWLAQEGIAIAWFPGVQTGASHLANIRADGSIHYLNQPSLAAALNAYSYAEVPDSLSGPTLYDGELRLVRAQLRNQPGDPDYAEHLFDDVEFAGFAFGGASRDALRGSDQANNFLYGGAENDFLFGGSNDDFLYGQSGNDTMWGGTGIDHIFGGSGSDRIYAYGALARLFGGQGADEFFLSDTSQSEIMDFDPRSGDIITSQYGSYVTSLQKQDLNKDGNLDYIVSFKGGGSVTLFGHKVTSGSTEQSNQAFSGEDLPVWIKSYDNIDLGSDRADYLVASSLGDTVFGGALQDTVVGGTGRDKVTGGSGADIISSRAGMDTVYGGTGNDTIKGGDGNDSLRGGQGSDVLRGETGVDRFSGGDGHDRIFGGQSRDYIFGQRGNDTLHGEAGNDQVAGGDNDDRIFGGRGNDSLYGENGRDMLYGSYGNDRIFGGDSADRLFGGLSNDLLYGGNGNDWLSGGTGFDILAGGNGSDSFVFSKGDKVTRVKDFSDLQNDRIIVDGFSSLHDFDDILRYGHDTGGGFKVSLEGTTLLLEGVKEADLLSSQFAFLDL